MIPEAMHTLNWRQIDALIDAALEEDLGLAGDITSTAIFDGGQRISARFVAREPGVLAGLNVALRVFSRFDPAMAAGTLLPEGAPFSAGAELGYVNGLAASVLPAERTALNFLRHLTGVATLTRAFVDRVKGTKARITDTRKTTPLLRGLEKYAVTMGGGINHRFGLFDAAMVKDNHIAAAGSIGAAIRSVRARIPHTATITCEVDRLDQIEEALAAGADSILLDNMTAAELRQAVALVGGRARTEASGGVRLETVGEIAATGVDLISVGALTHSPRQVDIALDVQ